MYLIKYWRFFFLSTPLVSCILQEIIKRQHSWSEYLKVTAEQTCQNCYAMCTFSNLFLFHKSDFQARLIRLILMLSFPVTNKFVPFVFLVLLFSSFFSVFSLMIFVYCFIVIIVIFDDAVGLKIFQNGLNFSTVVKLYDIGTGNSHLHTAWQ